MITSLKWYFHYSVIHTVQIGDNRGYGTLHWGYEWRLSQPNALNSGLGSIAGKCVALWCKISLQWRHGRDGVSNHQPHHCLLNRLFRRRSKKTSKAPRHWPVTGEFPAQRPVTRKMFPFDDVTGQSTTTIIKTKVGSQKRGYQLWFRIRLFNERSPIWPAHTI